MGALDSFYDEESECPKCHAKVKNDWQTKELYRLMEYWRKGDWVQYRKLEAIREGKRKKEYEDLEFGPLLRTSKEYLSDAPLLFNGKVPVHTSCRNCNVWLEAYAEVLDGRFAEIVEIEADAKPKEFVIIKPETTAKILREEFQRRLTHLQGSCKHQKTQWMDMEWAPGHFYGRGLVCLRCEEIIKTKIPHMEDRPKLKRLPEVLVKRSRNKRLRKLVGPSFRKRAARNIALFRQATSPTGMTSVELRRELKKNRAEDKKREKALERRPPPTRPQTARVKAGRRWGKEAFPDSGEATFGD